LGVSAYDIGGEILAEIDVIKKNLEGFLREQGSVTQEAQHV
jgi:hypothetical protein